jgi:hypothetical protein
MAKLILLIAKKIVIGWFRSTSPDTEVAGTLPLRHNDSFDMCPPSASNFFHRTYLSQTSLCPSSQNDFNDYYLIFISPLSPLICAPFYSNTPNSHANASVRIRSNVLNHRTYPSHSPLL